MSVVGSADAEEDGCQSAFDKFEALLAFSAWNNMGVSGKGVSTGNNEDLEMDVELLSEEEEECALGLIGRCCACAACDCAELEAFAFALLLPPRAPVKFALGPPLVVSATC